MPRVAITDSMHIEYTIRVVREPHPEIPGNHFHEYLELDKFTVLVWVKDAPFWQDITKAIPRRWREELDGLVLQHYYKNKA